MKKMIVSFAIALSIFQFLGGCATRYQSMGFYSKEGYNDFRLAKDKFSITFRGNSYTTEEDAYKFALLRASELTVQNNYQYFVVLEEKDISTASKSYSSSEYLEVVSDKVLPGVSIIIKCFEEEPKKDWGK